MAKKSRRPSPSAPAAEKKSGVTLERAVRLYRLLHILRKNPQTRKALLHRLRVDMRAFYRDLDALRDAGIEVVLNGRHYRLTTPADAAVLLLPFPDPLLTLGDALTLAKGRSRAHRLLKQRIKEVVG